MLENMGKPVKKADLKRLGIHYDFKKKPTLPPYFTRRTQNEELQEAKQLIRKFPQHPLVKSDVKRPEILRDFVALVEDEFNDVPEADISRWLSNFIDTDARLTP
ncbi:MAG: hypothetical protein KAS66_15155 [Candidatus Omnitrophica bacterium]|nr:hypothetical protein [Candidatus Omnitrophota bacterium]